MKGTIVKCLEELVVSQFGNNQWEKSLRDAGLNTSMIILPFADIEDAVMMQIISAVCKNLNLSFQQIADAFGQYWVNVYSQKVYPHYYQRHRTAKDFLLAMDDLHVLLTKTIKNAHPPRFDYEQPDEHTLIMYYRSQRDLIDFVVGLAKGVGTFYHENLEVNKLGADMVQILFHEKSD